MKEHATSTLRLVSGGLDYRCKVGNASIAVVPLEAPAPPLDAVVVEQDTHCLLAVDPEVTIPEGTPAQLADEIGNYQPRCGGEVVIRRGEPLQLYAIVHDLDLSPSWREEWITSALGEILDIAAQRRLQNLGMPVLGAVHGGFSQERFIELLLTAIGQQTRPPMQIWLGVPRSGCSSAIATMRRCSAR